MATYRSILVRDDTVLGFCFAVAQDFGFNPLYLRLLFAVVLFWSPAAAVVGYAVLGAVVALSRRLFPDPETAEQADPAQCPDEACEELPLAA